MRCTDDDDGIDMQYIVMAIAFYCCSSRNNVLFECGTPVFLFPFERTRSALLCVAQ